MDEFFTWLTFILIPLILYLFTSNKFLCKGEKTLKESIKDKNIFQSIGITLSFILKGFRRWIQRIFYWLSIPVVVISSSY